MTVLKITIADARFESVEADNGEIRQGNAVDQRDNVPITIGYGRYDPGSSLDADILVDDVMIVLEGRLSVASEAGTLDAGPGEIVHMRKGASVIITAHEEGAVTAYVTYPHWQVAEGLA